MMAFSELTQRGKARRLRRVAFEALTHFDLDVVGLELLGMFTNALFRVRTSDGGSQVLRCCAPGWRTDTDLRSEAMWLLALSREADVGAPVPLFPRDGDTFATVSVDGVPGPNRCTVMSFIPGTPLGRHLSEANLAKMGGLFARMHAHGAAFEPPEGFTDRKMTSYIARGEPDILFSPDCLQTMDDRSREVLLETRARVEAAFCARYADTAELQVIHNDLWHGNIHIYRGRLHPLDFEDTLWGYPVQDIAMALQDLMDDVDAAAFEPYAAAFRDGYEALAHWPERHEDEIDLFRAGRMLWVLNWVAWREEKYLVQTVARFEPLLKRFLDTGRLRKLG